MDREKVLGIIEAEFCDMLLDPRVFYNDIVMEALGDLLKNIKIEINK